MLKVDTNRDDLLNNNDKKESEVIYEYKKDEQTYEFIIPNVDNVRLDNSEQTEE